jgi:hypothetical protein
MREAPAPERAPELLRFIASAPATSGRADGVVRRVDRPGWGDSHTAARKSRAGFTKLGDRCFMSGWSYRVARVAL